MGLDPAYRPDVGGHAPGRLRDDFMSAVDAFERWEPDRAEPELLFGADRVPVRLSRICEHLRLCTDPMPSGLTEQLVALSGRQLSPGASYGDGARALAPLIGMRAIRHRLFPVSIPDAA